MAFVAQAQAVLDYSANLTDQQKVIAEYWADGPSSELPPGHWNLFAQSISDRDFHSIDADATMFFALNGAIFDASIATWGNKREFDYVRPVTAIRELFRDKQVLAWAGPNQGSQYRTHLVSLLKRLTGKNYRHFGKFSLIHTEQRFWQRYQMYSVGTCTSFAQIFVGFYFG